MAQFFNFATLTFNGNDINSNVTTGEIREVIFAEKTALRGVYNANDDITYIVSITNSSQTALTGLTVTDDLGGYTAGETVVYPLAYVDGSAKIFVDGVPGGAPTAVAGPPLSFTGIDIPAGASVILAYEALPTAFAPLHEGAQITNTVTITGGGITTPATATETVTAESAPLLSISKALNPSVVTENGRITYTFVIENKGNIPVVETDDVIFSDDFDPVLSNLTATFNSTAWTENTNYTYNEQTGEFVTLPGQITVPAATFTRNSDGSYTVVPGISVITITGNI